MSVITIPERKKPAVTLSEAEIQAIMDKFPEPPRRKPMPKPALVASVSEKFAEAAKANPGSVRLSAVAENETIVVERPRRTEMLEVLEVDAEGRPAKAKRYDALTNEWSIINFNGGYRQPSGAVSVYDPYAREDD